MIIEDGWRNDETTGILLGRHLEPDQYTHDSAPLYVYNRSVRFRELCYKFVDPPSVQKIMRIFCCLEDFWQKDKTKYSTTRKYFLSQKLLCKEIASYIGVSCRIKRPIHDKKRLANQMEILQRLMADFLLLKKEQPRCRLKCTSDNNPSNIIFDQAPSYPFPAGKLPDTPLGMLELIATFRHRWPSNLGATTRHIC